MPSYLTNVAIIGASGHAGSTVVSHLLATNKHKITALTRPDSTNSMPDGVQVAKVSYTDHSSLVSALQNQDILIISLSVTAPRDTQFKLIDAALEAGIKYIMPNEWGTLAGAASSSLKQDLGMMIDGILKVREYIESKGLTWISLCCGFWYEFSLAGTEARYGFDFEQKKVTFYDEGTTRINTSTFPQVGRAVAALLSLPVESEGPCVSKWKNRPLVCSSFFVSQRDMFESVLRVTGDKESDWKIGYEGAEERFKRGGELMRSGQMVGFGILLYARMFYDDGAGNFNDKLDNEALGLPKEDFDEATKVAIQMAADGDTNTIGQDPARKPTAYMKS